MRIKLRQLLRAAPFLIIIGLHTIAEAARFPDAVKEEITFKGTAAISIASLLGLDTGHDSSVTLQLGDLDAGAVHLLENKGSDHMDRHIPPTYNFVRYLAGENPSLVIHPNWLDEGTALPNRNPGILSFNSPPLDPKLTEDDSWSNLVRKLKSRPEWRGEADAERFGTLLLCEEVKDTGAHGFQLQVYTVFGTPWAYKVRIQVQAP